MKVNDVFDTTNPINATPKPMIASFEDIITDQNATLKMLRSCLENLLATIHRDGGQCVEKLGIEQATVDAIEKWYMTQVNFEDAKNRVTELAEVVEHKDSLIVKQEKHNDELKRGIKTLVDFVTRLRGEWQNSVRYGSNPMTPEIIDAMCFIVGELGGNDGNE